jgi:hypothetical protein
MSPFINMGSYTLDEAGLRIRYESGQETFLDWSEVHSVHLSKIAIPPASTLTYLTFDTGYGEYIELNDEDEGWRAVLANLARRIGKSQADLQDAVDEASPQGGTIQIYARSN